MSGPLVSLTCDCDCGSKCPQGKVGAQAKCVILVRPDRIAKPKKD